MSDTIDWQARCEAAEAHNIKITREWSVQVAEMRKELERVQKAAAEMREALQSCLDTPDAEIHDIEHAISSDAGRDYHHRDEYKPLAMRLKDCVFFLEDYLRTVTHPGVSRLVSDSKTALEEASQKGLTV